MYKTEEIKEFSANDYFGSRTDYIKLLESFLYVSLITKNNLCYDKSHTQPLSTEVFCFKH